MKYFLVICMLCFSQYIPGQKYQSKNIVTKIEMHLSAFGVESDDFPSIDADIDFIKMESVCKKTFYNPAYKNSVYFLSGDTIMSVLKLLSDADLAGLKEKYSTTKTDQPSSTMKIFTAKKIYTIEDYGLTGTYPLQELYQMVYRF